VYCLEKDFNEPKCWKDHEKLLLLYENGFAQVNLYYIAIFFACNLKKHREIREKFAHMREKQQGGATQKAETIVGPPSQINKK